MLNLTLAAAENVAATDVEISDVMARAKAASSMENQAIGVYKTIEIREAKNSTTVTTRYPLNRPAGVRLQRIEREVTSAPGTSHAKVRSEIRIKDEEGFWTLYPEAKAAVLTPHPLGAGVDLEKLPAMAALKEIAEAPPEKRREVAAKYFLISGEHCTVEGRECLRVTKVLSPEMQVLVTKTALELVDAQKKQMSLAARVALKFVSVKRMIAEKMPVRFDTWIDRTDGTILDEKTYNAKGDELTARSGNATSAPEFCGDYDLEKLRVPENYERHRPETAEEAQKLCDALKKGKG